MAVFFLSIDACFVVTNVLFSKFFLSRSILRWEERSVFSCCSPYVIVVVSKIGMLVPVDVWRVRTKRIGFCAVSVVSWSTNVIICPRYFTFSSGGSIPSCIPSTSTSLVLFVFWFVRSWVLSGWISSPCASVLCKKSAIIFCELFQRGRHHEHVVGKAWVSLLFRHSV